MFGRKKSLSIFIVLLMFFTVIPFNSASTYKYVGVTISNIRLHKAFDYGKYCNAYFNIVVRSLKKYSRWRGKETYVGDGKTAVRSVPQPGTRGRSPIYYKKIYIVSRQPHTVVVYITMMDSDYGRDRVIGTFRIVPNKRHYITNVSAGSATAKVELYFQN